MIRELTDLRDYFRSLSECSTQLSTPDRALPALLLLNRNLTSGEQQVECVALIYTSRGVFIGAKEGLLTWLSG
jgi:hypothetical protein